MDEVKTVEEKSKLEEKQLNFSIPLALYEIIKVESDRQCQTMAALVRIILNDWAGERFKKQTEKD
jgi:hypothetical protein